MAPLPDLDSSSDWDTQIPVPYRIFSIGSDSDSDPLIEMYVIGVEICPWDRVSGNMFCKYYVAIGSGIRVRIRVWQWK